MVIAANASRKGIQQHTPEKGVQQRTMFRASSSLSPMDDFKERVFVCNAFVDDQAVLVSSEKGSHGSELAFTQCEHYDVDIEGGSQLLLQAAESDEAVDALSFKGAPTDEGCGGVNYTCVAVFHRRGKRSPKGIIQWFRVPNDAKKPEIVTVDTYALAGDEAARGLAAAGIPGIGAAVFRLEDKLNPDLELSRQVVASRTLSLGRVYSASPGNYHLILEDLTGNSVGTYEDIDVVKGGQYIMMRVGEPGSKQYPERLVFRPLVEPPKHSSAHSVDSLTFGTVLILVTIFTLSG